MTKFISFDGTYFTVSSNKSYWTHISIDVPPKTKAYAGLFGPDNNLKLIKSHTDFSQLDTMSKNGFITLKTGEQLSAMSNFVSQSFHWVAFRLDNLFHPLVAFSVARNNHLTMLGRITYNVILTNIGWAWNESFNFFLAPKRAQYFFSLSSVMFHTAPTTVNEFVFVVNEMKIQYFKTGAASLISQGIDLVSMSCFVQMKSGDKLSTVLNSGFLFNNATNLYQTTLSGFMYNIPHIALQASLNFVHMFLTLRVVISINLCTLGIYLFMLTFKYALYFACVYVYYNIHIYVYIHLCACVCE